MTKTIVLTDLRVNYLFLDYENQRVLADFSLVDSNGQAWETSQAIFWVTIPDPGRDENGNPRPIPVNWFQLPASYFPILVQLRNDADQALTAKFLP